MTERPLDADELVGASEFQAAAIEALRPSHPAAIIAYVQAGPRLFATVEALCRALTQTTSLLPLARFDALSPETRAATALAAKVLDRLEARRSA